MTNYVNSERVLRTLREVVDRLETGRYRVTELKWRYEAVLQQGDITLYYDDRGEELMPETPTVEAVPARRPRASRKKK